MNNKREPLNEPNELDQLRSENETLQKALDFNVKENVNILRQLSEKLSENKKLREWIKNVVNRESMYAVKGQGKTLTAKEIREAKTLLNK